MIKHFLKSSDLTYMCMLIISQQHSKIAPYFLFQHTPFSPQQNFRHFWLQRNYRNTEVLEKNCLNQWAFPSSPGL